MKNLLKETNGNTFTADYWTLIAMVFNVLHGKSKMIIPNKHRRAFPTWDRSMKIYNLFGLHMWHSLCLFSLCSKRVWLLLFCIFFWNLSLSWTSSLPPLQVLWGPSLAQLSRCTEEVLYTFPMMSHSLLISNKQGALAGKSNRDCKLISWNHEITALGLSWTASGLC